MIQWIKLDEKKQDQSQVTMKKYHQLLVTSIAIISTVLFVFYKHEYDRLRTVLQVLETFGNPNPHQQECATAAKEESSDSYLLPLPPSWQQKGSVYLYSAHVPVKTDGSVTVRVLGLLQPHSQPPKNCFVWFESSTEPVVGKLSIESLDAGIISEPYGDNPSYIAVIFNCLASHPAFYPYAVSVVEDDYPDPLHIVYVSGGTGANKELTNGSNRTIAACILPLSGPYRNKLQLLEFLEFHRIVGVVQFYIYDQGMEPRVHRLLETYRKKSGTRINVMSWNVPEGTENYQTQSNALLVNDCLFRSQQIGAYLMVTDISQFLMPRYHGTLHNVLDDIEMAVTKPAVSHFSIQRRLFCLEYPNDPHARDLEIPLTLLLKTRWRTSDSHDMIKMLINSKLVNHVWSNFTPSTLDLYQEYTIPADVMLFHWYRNCGRGSPGKRLSVDSPSQHDDMAYRFQDKLINFNLLQLGKM